MSHLSQVKEYENKSKENRSKEEFLFPVEDQELYDIRFYMHNIYEHLFNGKVGAPVHKRLQDGAKVLEFCCGDSGIWTTEVAAEYPNSEFYAVNSNASNSSHNNKFNVTFIECDIFKKLSFIDNEFDYVFCKDKFLFIEKNTFFDVLLEIIRVLKPGGWLEVVYASKTDPIDGRAHKRLLNAWNSWLKMQNTDYDIMINLEHYIQKTGKAESILHRIVDVPMRSGYAFGEFFIEVFLFYYRSARDYLAPFMNISFEEYDDLANNVENELKAEDNRTIKKIKQVLARKKCKLSEETHIVSSTK